MNCIPNVLLESDTFLHLNVLPVFRAPICCSRSLCTYELSAIKWDGSFISLYSLLSLLLNSVAFSLRLHLSMHAGIVLPVEKGCHFADQCFCVTPDLQCLSCFECHLNFFELLSFPN